MVDNNYNCIILSHSDSDRSAQSRDGSVGYRGEINTGRHAKTGTWQKRTESKCATREIKMRKLLKGLILWRADGVICEKSCNT